MPYTLFPEDSSRMDELWFKPQLDRHVHNPYEACYTEEVAALKDFYDGKTNAEHTADAITQPISRSSIQDLGDYSDDAVALCQMWSLMKRALIEWPASRTADLVALLSAITKVTNSIHRGELLDDDDEEPRTWAELPWFHMVWSDAFWRTPGQIARQAINETSRKHECEVYIKQQDVEARLVAAGIFEWNRAHLYMIRTLERKPTPEDIRDAASDGEAAEQLKLEFQIPAVSKWVEHNGERLYRTLDELKDWHKKRLPFQLMHFDDPLERWAFWQKRLHEIADDTELDTTTQDAARTTLQYMGNIG